MYFIVNNTGIQIKMRKSSFSFKPKRIGKQPLSEPNTHSLTYYFPPVSKAKVMEEKKAAKQQQKFKRNGQLLITNWIYKNVDKSNDNNPWVQIDKPVMLIIYQFLNLSEAAIASRTCRYFHKCFNSIWLSFNYFQNFNLSKFRPAQLNKVMEKSTRITHMRQLKRLFIGKRLLHCAQKLLLIARASQQKGTLEQLQVEPKRHNAPVFIMDQNLKEICLNSCSSLTIISLVGCCFLTSKSLVLLSKCKKLTSLTLTKNNFIKDQDIQIICRHCIKLTHVNLSSCGNLTEACLNSLASLPELQSLDLSNFQNSMGTLGALGIKNNLEINLSGSYVNDHELGSLLKHNRVSRLSIVGCPYICEATCQFIRAHKLTNLVYINVSRLCLSQSSISDIVQHSGVLELVWDHCTPEIEGRLEDKRRKNLNKSPNKPEKS